MSTAEFGELNLGQAPAPAPVDGQLSPLTLSPAAPAPVEPPVQPVASAPEPVAPPAPAAPSRVPVQDMRDVPLGTLIFREGLLTEEQLEEALQDGMRRGKRLGEVLLERGLVSERDLGRLLAGQKGLQFVELDAAVVDPAAVQLLPVEKARLHSVLPIGFQNGLPVVAVADPSNDLVVENVRRALNCEPLLVVAGREALHRQIEAAYAAAPATVEAPVETPVAPVAPAPEPVVAMSVTTEPEVAAVPAQDGVWLGAQQPEPVAVEPAQPVVVPTAPLEPVAISYAPVEPVAEPAVEMPAVAPLVEPLAAPVVEPVAVVEPVVTPEPAMAHEPVFTPEPALVPEPVVSAPTPAATQPAAEQAVEEPMISWIVSLRLASGEQLEIGAFNSEAEAKEHAQAVVRQISTDYTWPFFAGRFVRPDAIVSVELTEVEPGRWLGSSARRQAWADAQPQS